MKDTGGEYAVKIMEKRFIRKEKKVKFVMMERKVFSRVSHDRIVKLFFTFQVCTRPVWIGARFASDEDLTARAHQDNNYLFMVMELCRGGELLDVIMYARHNRIDSVF